jgi:hypothetical protein
MNRETGHIALAALVLAAIAPFAGTRGGAQEPVRKGLGYANTPLLPDGKWRVHDGTRPQPAVVKPGATSASGPSAAPPSDAVILFDGTSQSSWQAEKGGPASWQIEDGALVVVPRSGDILTNEKFGDVQLHIEWATPAKVEGEGQGRGNSGVFLMNRYEVQVLDSYENPTYPDGQAAAIYGQVPPLVNASRRPGEWQTYDIVFIAPRFTNNKLAAPARATVIHNGVIVHHDVALIGSTAHQVVGVYEPHGDAEPIRLQDHGNRMRFRNIWARRFRGYDQR